MTRSRQRLGGSGRFALCLFALILFITLGAHVSSWAKSGPVSRIGDPGTPYEEPEAVDGTENRPAPKTAPQVGGIATSVQQPEITAPDAKTPDSRTTVLNQVWARQIALLFLLWN